MLERGTGVPAILTVLFGMSYGSVNTFVSMLAQEAHIADAGYFFGGNGLHFSLSFLWAAGSLMPKDLPGL